MRVLIACEESQRVCTAFRRLGAEAYSCDILPCSGGHPEWHIQSDVTGLIDGKCSFLTMDGVRHLISASWDLLIAHPPCTYLTVAGAKHLYRGHTLQADRYKKGLAAKEFLTMFLQADCPHIAVENPTPMKIFALPPHPRLFSRMSSVIRFRSERVYG